MPPARNLLIICVVGIVGIFVLLNFLFLSAPVNFPKGKMVNIKEGITLRHLSKDLKAENMIRSRIAFEAFVIVFGGEKHLIFGDYLFDKKMPVFEVAWDIAKGKHHLPSVKITIPEGFDISQIAETFAAKLHFFNKDNFLLKAKPEEGYLFPDTYFFLTTADENDALKSMNENFKKKIASVQSEITSSGKTEKEIIIMASIIEREAKGDADRAIISGILWNRISKKMPLQVDALPSTYKTEGLPQDPICNPGLEAIKASIHPENSPYLYYLHDKDGVIHYARNFEEHKLNKIKYLK
jgi:UPF0755 protein